MGTIEQRLQILERESEHHPIPELGTQVRAYLQGTHGSWKVVLPNGFVILDPNLSSDALEVSQLYSGFTYALPIE